MPSTQTPRTKPAHPPKKSPHATWQAQQQKQRPPRRMLKRLAGKR
jgi:hypothetical protein